MNLTQITMQYLLDKKKASARAHIYYEDKDDTACRMYSTGGLRSKSLILTDEIGERPVCKNCNNMHRYNESMDEQIKYMNMTHVNPVLVPYSIATHKYLSLEAIGFAALLYAVLQNTRYRFELSDIVDTWYHGKTDKIYRVLKELIDEGYVRKTGFTEYELSLPENLLYQ